MLEGGNFVDTISFRLCHMVGIIDGKELKVSVHLWKTACKVDGNVIRAPPNTFITFCSAGMKLLSHFM
jgi:hypothetical protein